MKQLRAIRRLHRRNLPRPPTGLPARRRRTHAAAALGRSLIMCALALPIPGPVQAAPRGEQPRAVLDPDAEAALLDVLVAASPHRLALQSAQQAGLPDPPAGPAPLPLEEAPPPAAPPKAWPAKQGRRCYGFLPYWTLNGVNLHWPQLTQIAWFAAEAKADGGFSSLHGWGGAGAKAFIAQAHKHGVQVPLTVTLFSKAGIAQVLSTAASRKKWVDDITALVISGGGDGVNIDFEGLALADRDKMSAFISLLTQTMHAKLPGSDVTLATPAVDWSGAWDYQYLAEHSDGLFVMAYGLHWKGGDPGPQLPMAALPPWKHKTLPWVVDDYFKYGKAANKHKIIIGLPLYGNAWPSSSDQPGAQKTANGSAVTLESAELAAPGKGGWKYDAASQSAWYVWKSGGAWVQSWVETPKTFKLRTEYLSQRDVHLGLWALGYADEMPDVWQAIAEYQGTGAAANPGQDAGGTAADAGVADTGGTSPDGSSADAGSAPPDAAPADLDAPVPSADGGLAAADVAQPAPDAPAVDVAASEDAGRSPPVADTWRAATDALNLDGGVGGAPPVAARAAAASSGCAAGRPATAPPLGLTVLCAALALLWARPRRA